MGGFCECTLFVHVTRVLADRRLDLISDCHILAGSHIIGGSPLVVLLFSLMVIEVDIGLPHSRVVAYSWRLAACCIDVSAVGDRS